MEEQRINRDPEKALELVYYHLIAMDYSDSVIEKTKEKLNLILNPKNKNPEKYKIAYDLLKKAIEKSQKVNNDHKEKAKLHVSSSISPDKLSAIKRKREIENESLVRVHLNRGTEEPEIEFTTADKL